jgi:DNA invertase Pin-like site-specific DNA recombinase
MPVELDRVVPCRAHLDQDCVSLQREEEALRDRIVDRGRYGLHEAYTVAIALGCEHIATDKASGASIDRPGLAEALGKARKGDTLVIWKLDRLGRTMKGLVDLAADLSACGIELRSLTDGIDTGTHIGRLLFHILGSIAEMERELIRKRTMAGLATRRKTGGGGRGGAQIRPDTPQARYGG